MSLVDDNPVNDGRFIGPIAGEVYSSPGFPRLNSRGQAAGFRWAGSAAPITTQVWELGTRRDARDYFVEGGPRDLVSAWQFNNDGDLLATERIPGKEQPQFVIVSPYKLLLEVIVEPDEAEIGEVFEVRLHVRNRTGRDLSSVRLGGNGIVPSGTTGSEFAGELPGPIALLDGQSGVLRYPVRARGTGELAFRAKVTSDVTGGGRIDSQEELSNVVRIRTPSPLELSLSTRPLVTVAGREEPIVDMELDGEGVLRDAEGNAVALSVDLKIANTSQDDVQVILQDVAPRARDRSPALDRIDVEGNFPENAVRLAAGAEVVREFPVTVREDGRFDFEATLTGYYVDAPAVTFSDSIRKAPIAVGEPYPLEVELEIADAGAVTRRNNGAIFIVPGSDPKVIATVRNRTSNATINFFGIEAEGEANAGGAVLTVAEAQDGEFPAFAVDHELDAGGSIVLSGRLLSHPDGAPAGTIRWIPPQFGTIEDDATGNLTELHADDILWKADFAGWLGDDKAVRVVQDFSRPVVRHTRWERFAQAGPFAKSAVANIGHWYYGNIDLVFKIGGGVRRVWDDPSLLAEKMGTVTRGVWQGAEMMALAWGEMTPDQREQVVRELAVEMYRRSFYMARDRVPFDPEDFDSALNFARAVTYPMFDNVSAAYAEDDPAKIAEVWGAATSSAFLEVASAFLPTAKARELATTADLARLAVNTSAGRLTTEQVAYLRAVKNGRVPAEDVARFWGADLGEMETMRGLMRAFGIKGYARERNPVSTRLINDLDEAIWKPENMKPKTLAREDVEILGTLPRLPSTHGGAALDLDGVVAIYDPGDLAALRTRLQQAGHGEEVVRILMERARKQQEDFGEYRALFQRWKDEGFDVHFNYRDNGTTRPGDVGPVSKRAFDFDEVVTEGGVTMYVPRLANEAGAMRYVSGDMDWVHFSFLDGSPLDPKTAANFYTLASRVARLNHGDAFSWILDGQSLFKQKANQLVDYIRGQKALLEVSPDEFRAVRIRERLSILDSAGRNHFIHFAGARKSLVSPATGLQLELAFNRLLPAYPVRAAVLPLRWTGRAVIEERGWEYSEGENAEILREGEGGQIERFDGLRWTAWNGGGGRIAPRDNGGPDETPVPIAPASTLLAAAPVGAGLLTIEPVDELFAAELEGKLGAWFEPGGWIVISPGAPWQEFRRIVTVEPLVLERPLDHAHPANAMVALLPAGFAIPGEAVAIRSVVFVPDETGAGHFHLEVDVTRAEVVEVETSGDLQRWEMHPVASADAGVWTEGVLDLRGVDTGEGLRVTIIVESPGAGVERERFLRLRAGFPTGG